MPFEAFPSGAITDTNPAIRLFGKRLFIDQSTTELLIELLLVAHSRKRVGSTGESFDSALPTEATLAAWDLDALQYAPVGRLDLKLFSFMGASRLDARHEAHRDRLKHLLNTLEGAVRVTEAGTEQDALRTLENLLLGFQGAGSGRTWCAQSFLPICRGVLAHETIWNESVARRKGPRHWSDLTPVQTYFAKSKHLFLARGGELLYLQICNALRQTPTAIRAWADSTGVSIEPAEQTPSWLHGELQRALGGVFDQCPQKLGDIVEFLDGATESHDLDDQYVEAGWCPVASWQEGYLFATELLRLCNADLDIIERLRLLESACAMQVLRSIATQSARQATGDRKVTWPGYRLAVSAPDEPVAAVKRISRYTAKVVERLVYRAIRSTGQPPSDVLLKEADSRYGGKLFTSIAKRIGLLVPRRGGGVRFTLNEQLLRFLVITTVPLAGRLTYDRFKQIVEARHGLVFDADGFARANVWADGSERLALGSEVDAWLKEMLAAAGLLENLSDSCALVVNRTEKKVVAA